MGKGDARFAIWTKQGISYEQTSDGKAKFHGEIAWKSDPKAYDADGDSASDGQEVYGYKVTVTCYEQRELKSKDVRVKSDPRQKYAGADGQLLDVDGDGISDRDEMDPKNSTTPAVVAFYRHYQNNESMIKDQFNPFMRESVPPLLIGASAESHVTWGVCWLYLVPYPCVTRAWTVVMVHVLDVAPYTVTVRVKDNGAARSFGGSGDWRSI